jgi:predicted nuclease with TOPRIM domain
MAIDAPASIVLSPITPPTGSHRPETLQQWKSILHQCVVAFLTRPRIIHLLLLWLLLLLLDAILAPDQPLSRSTLQRPTPRYEWITLCLLSMATFYRAYHASIRVVLCIVFLYAAFDLASWMSFCREWRCDDRMFALADVLTYVYGLLLWWKDTTVKTRKHTIHVHWMYAVVWVAMGAYTLKHRTYQHAAFQPTTSTRFNWEWWRWLWSIVPAIHGIAFVVYCCVKWGWTNMINATYKDKGGAYSLDDKVLLPPIGRHWLLHERIGESPYRAFGYVTDEDKDDDDDSDTISTTSLERELLLDKPSHEPRYTLAVSSVEIVDSFDLCVAYVSPNLIALSWIVPRGLAMILSGKPVFTDERGLDVEMNTFHYGTESRSLDDFDLRVSVDNTADWNHYKVDFDHGLLWLYELSPAKPLCVTMSIGGYRSKPCHVVTLADETPKHRHVPKATQSLHNSIVALVEKKAAQDAQLALQHQLLFKQKLHVLAGREERLKSLKQEKRDMQQRETQLRNELESARTKMQRQLVQDTRTKQRGHSLAEQVRKIKTRLLELEQELLRENASLSGTAITRLPLALDATHSRVTEDLRDRLHALEQDLSKTHQQHGKHLSDLRSRVLTLTNNVNDTEGKLEKSARSFSIKNIAALEQEIVDVDDKHLAAVDYCKQLQHQLSTEKQDPIIMKHVDMDSAVAHEILALEERNASLERLLMEERLFKQQLEQELNNTR